MIFRTSGFLVATIGICGLLVPRLFSADDRCEIPASLEQPASGHWSGSFKFVFEPVLPGTPIPSINYAWEGGLSYEVRRPDKGDPIPPPSPSPSRRPLHVPGAPPLPVPPGSAAPGQFASDEEQVQAVLRWYAEHAPPDPTPDGQDAEIEGETETHWRAHLTDSSDGFTEMAANSTRDLSAREHGDEDPGPPPRFTTIALIGNGDPFQFTSSGVFISRDGVATENGTQAQTVITDEQGRSVTVGPIGQGPTSKGKIALLSVDESNCSEMSGKVAFSDQILQSTAAYGIHYNTLSSEWKAELDERDQAFEDRAEELASEPVPAMLDQAYIDHFRDAWLQLRGSGKISNYRHCVLKKLEHKFVILNAAALRMLLKSFPKASDGATCHVFAAAFLRILPIVRLLQLYGASAEDCPLADEWTELAQREIPPALEKLLAGPHTMSDLQCYMGLERQGIVDLGKLTEPLQNEIVNLSNGTPH